MVEDLEPVPDAGAPLLEQVDRRCAPARLQKSMGREPASISPRIPLRREQACQALFYLSNCRFWRACLQFVDLKDQTFERDACRVEPLTMHVIQQMSFLSLL